MVNLREFKTKTTIHLVFLKDQILAAEQAVLQKIIILLMLLEILTTVQKCQIWLKSTK